MTTKVQGTQGIEFPDSTQQATAAAASKLPVAMGIVTGGGSLVAGIGYGFASASRVSQGAYDVTFSTPMADANYVVQATCDASTLGIIPASLGSQSSGSKVRIQCYDAASTPTDAQFNICVWRP